MAQLSQEQTLDYGCAGINSTTNEIVHYTDKPASFVSKDINAGVFLMDFNIFNIIASYFQKKLKRTLSFSGALVFVLNIFFYDQKLLRSFKKFQSGVLVFFHLSF